MTLPVPIEIYLVCFAAGSIIHGILAVLAAKLMRDPSGFNRADARDGLALALTTFFWQFGNFIAMFAASLRLGETNVLFLTGQFIRGGALVSFPLLFSYIGLDQAPEWRTDNTPSTLSRYLRYALW